MALYQSVQADGLSANGFVLTSTTMSWVLSRID
jgi:hypothetical protein